MQVGDRVRLERGGRGGKTREGVIVALHSTGGDNPVANSAVVAWNKGRPPQTEVALPVLAPIKEDRQWLYQLVELGRVMSRWLAGQHPRP